MSIAKSIWNRTVKVLTAVAGLGAGAILAYILEDVHRAARLAGWIQ